MLVANGCHFVNTVITIAIMTKRMNFSCMPLCLIIMCHNLAFSKCVSSDCVITFKDATYNAEM